MKKLLACLLCMMLLLGAVACNNTPDPSPSDPTPNDPSVSDNGGSDGPSSVTTDDGIEDRSQLLNGKKTSERALYLWNGMFEDSEINDMVSSLTQDMSLALHGTMQGYAISAEVTAKQLLIEGEGAIKPFAYEEGKNVTTMIVDENTTYTSTTTLKSGYADGKIFEYCSNDDGANGVYATHSAAQWETYRSIALSESSLAPIIDAEDCENKGFEFAGRNYTVRFSGFTDEGIAKLCDLFSLTDMPIDQTPTDLLIEATFRRDLLPTEMKISFVFEEADGENLPSCEIVMSFKDYNKTEPITVDMSGWRDVGNMLYAQRALHRPKELKEAAVASFDYSTTISIYQNNTYVTGGTTSYEILYSNAEDGGYAFSIQSTQGGTSYSYADGIYQIIGGDNQGSYEITDERAREMMDPFVDPMGVDILWLLRATKNEYNANMLDYTLVMKTCDDEWLAERLELLNATKDDVIAQQIYVTAVEDGAGNLTDLCYDLSVTVDSGYSMRYIVTLENISMTE